MDMLVHMANIGEGQRVHYQSKFNSPIGMLFLEASEKGLVSITRESKKIERNDNDILKLAQAELEAYFRGELKSFTVPLDISGTEYQMKCWNELLSIPYGRTVSYKEQALKVANARHVRAVAGANNKNKLPILIPCHRVIGHNGDLVGYAWGLEVKQFLIDLEAKKKVPK